MDKTAYKNIEIKIPQLGEGLREVKIVRFLKKPGDWIKEEEALYEMETDKSLVEVESSHQGKLKQWMVDIDTTVSVGSILGYIQAPEDEMESAQPKIANSEFRATPPRTRAYCKKMGISTEEMLVIPTLGDKLMPSDVDCYLQSKKIKPLSDENTVENPLTDHQKLLTQRFNESRVVQASFTSIISMDDLNKAILQLINTKTSHHEQQKYTSEFQVFAYIVAQVCKKFPMFRSMLISGRTLHTYDHVNLGIAVQANNGELVTAVITDADQYDLPAFIENMQHQLEAAFDGVDQARQRPHVILTYMGQNGVLFGAPLLVEPSVAILFLGSSYKADSKLLAHLSLTFDHRIINGILAANFLEEIRRYITGIFQPAEEENISDHSFEGFRRWLLNKLSFLLEKNERDINLYESLGIQGLDSLKVIELVKSLGDYFEKSFSPTLLWRHPSYELLVTYFKEQFNDSSKLPIRCEFDEFIDELEKLPSSELKKLLNEID